MEWSVLLEVAAPAGTNCLNVDGPKCNALVDRLGAEGAVSAIGRDGPEVFCLRLTVEGGDDVGEVLDRVSQLIGASLPEVMGTSEAAAMFRVSRQRLDELRKFKSFPKPVATLMTGPIWLRAALEAFAVSWEREKGRPCIPEEVRRLVDEEMKSIPRGDHAQNMFRSAYRNARSTVSGVTQRSTPHPRRPARQRFGSCDESFRASSH
jgi:hypothetical protein